MIVQVVLQAGIALGVGAGLVIEDDGLTVGHDQPGPDELDTRLGVGDLAVVFADQPGALRDKQVLAGRAVIDVFCHLGSDLAWQVRLNAGDEGRGNDGPGLDNEGRRGRRQAVGADSRRVGGPIQKRQFLVLHVLVR